MKPQYELLDAYIESVEHAQECVPDSDPSLDAEVARLVREVDALARQDALRPGFADGPEARLFGDVAEGVANPLPPAPGARFPAESAPRRNGADRATPELPGQPARKDCGTAADGWRCRERP